MDFLIITLCFGISIGLIQLIVALRLMRMNRDKPITYLLWRRSKQQKNREAVRDGSKTADEILSSKDFYKPKKTSQTDKFLQAGLLTRTAQTNYYLATALIAFTFSLTAVCYFGDKGDGILISAVIVAALCGAQLPKLWLEKKIISRNFQIIKDLPLVIDQLQINLTGSLELVPAIELYLNTLQQRGSYNAAAFHFEKVILLVYSGLSPSEAFKEAGATSGNPLIGNIFMFLANCQDHGTGISSQLSNLNEQATNIYQITIEERITRLPVKATLPLALVFAGFFAMTSSGVINKLLEAFPLDQ